MQQKNSTTCADHAQILMDFGLSYLQANVYLNLVKLGTANVKIIAQTSKVARQDVYRIMPILLEVGLGEKIIAKPAMYKATPLKDGVSILLRRKKDEHTELQKKKKYLLDNFYVNNKKTRLQEEETQFKITAETTLLLNMHKKMIQNIDNNLDVILLSVAKPAKLFEEWTFLDEVYKTRKNVNVRVITNESAKKLQGTANNVKFKIRYSVTPLHFGIHIFDNKEVTLSISHNSGIPCLWSNNPNVLMLTQNYFETLWNIALKA